MDLIRNLTRNVSSNERTLRMGGGLLLMTLAIVGPGFGSFFGFIFTVIGAVLVGTSILSFCPVYDKLGKNTFKS